MNERKNRPERVMALEKQPQREIRVVAVKKTTTRSGIMRILQRVVIVEEAQILRQNNQPLTSKQLY
jgi:hypothetical protein